MKQVFCNFQLILSGCKSTTIFLIKVCLSSEFLRPFSSKRIGLERGNSAELGVVLIIRPLHVIARVFLKFSYMLFYLPF